jgi:hypothetical protein
VTTYAPNQPRLLADYAAAPTRRERAGARSYWRAAQGDLLAAPIEQEHQADACPVCGGEHPEHECPHGVAPALFPNDEEHQADEQPRTSAQRDECRLTDADRAAIAAAVETFARATPNMGTGERFTTAERIAHRAIGCDERDLRRSEILAIAQIVRPILAANHPRQCPR